MRRRIELPRPRGRWQRTIWISHGEKCLRFPYQKCRLKLRVVRNNRQSSLDLVENLSVAAETAPFQAALERLLNPSASVVVAPAFVTHHERMLARGRIRNSE